MRGRDLTDLLLLAAIWGASFLFTRLGVESFGPFPLIELRVGLAALFLIPFVIMSGAAASIFRHWKPLFVLGLLNAVLPFTLYAYAAQSLDAGFLSVVNAVTPAWGGVIAWLWLKDRLPIVSTAGLVVGFAGIVVLVWDKLEFSSGGTGLGTLAALLAPVCYGIAANYTKRYLSSGVNPLAIACGSLSMAALVLLPLAWRDWPSEPVPFQAWAATVLLAILCTGVAYQVFYRLLASVGPTKTVTVTFLVPVFGVFWGAFLLHEPVTLQIVLGASIVLVGSGLVIGGGRLRRKSASTP